MAQDAPVTVIDKWAYFFREAARLERVPEPLAQKPFVEALDAARAARFTEEEWDAYIQAGMAVQDERGALALAERQGEQRGELKRARASLRRVLGKRGLTLDPQEDARIEACEDLSSLERWLDQAIDAPSVAEALR